MYQEAEKTANNRTSPDARRRAEARRSFFLILGVHLLILAIFLFVQIRHWIYDKRVAELRADFGQYSVDCDVGWLRSDVLCLQTREADLPDGTSWRGDFVRTDDGIYGLAAAWHPSETLRIYRGPTDGAPNELIFEIQHGGSNADVDATFVKDTYYFTFINNDGERALASYCIETGAYTPIATGEDVTLDAYRTPVLYEAEQVDTRTKLERFLGRRQDTVYFKIRNTQTGEVKLLDTAFIEQSPFIDSLEQVKYTIRRVEIVDNRVFLLLDIHSLPSLLTTPFILFEYDFEQETLDYKLIVLQEEDVYDNRLILIK